MRKSKEKKVSKKERNKEINELIKNLPDWKPLLNHSCKCYEKFMMTITETIDADYINGKVVLEQVKKEIVYLTYSSHKHNLFKDNYGTEDYKRNFYDIKNEIDYRSKKPFVEERTLEHFILNKVIRILGFITTPHSLAELLNIDLDIIIDDIEDRNIPHYQLGLKLFIPTAHLLQFIRIRKLGYEWYKWKMA